MPRRVALANQASGLGPDVWEDTRVGGAKVSTSFSYYVTLCETMSSGEVYSMILALPERYYEVSLFWRSALSFGHSLSEPLCRNLPPAGLVRLKVRLSVSSIDLAFLSYL